MATYIYLCEVHGEFEISHSIKEKLEECPKCLEEGLEPKKITRLISKSNFVLNGSCWGKDNYS